MDQKKFDDRIELYRYARTPEGLLKETSTFLPALETDPRARQLPMLIGHWFFFSVHSPLSEYLAVLEQHERVIPVDHDYWNGPFSQIPLKPDHTLITEQEFETEIAARDEAKKQDDTVKLEAYMDAKRSGAEKIIQQLGLTPAEAEAITNVKMDDKVVEPAVVDVGAN